jgi:hypothetical protein
MAVCIVVYDLISVFPLFQKRCALWLAPLARNFFVGDACSALLLSADDHRSLRWLVAGRADAFSLLRVGIGGCDVACCWWECRRGGPVRATCSAMLEALCRIGSGDGGVHRIRSEHGVSSVLEISWDVAASSALQ